MSNTALMNELKPLIDAATQEELARIRSGTPGAGASADASAPIGVVDPAAVEKLQGLSDADASAAAAAAIRAAPSPQAAANVRATLRQTHPNAEIPP
jgi:hypothetical protein